MRYMIFSVPGGLEVRDTRRAKTVLTTADMHLARSKCKELNDKEQQ